MSAVNDIIDRMRAAAQPVDRVGGGQPDRAQLQQIAAQFESMLLVQMLRDMRESGRWDEGDDPESGGLGADAFFESLDVELAPHLSAAKGLGLSQHLLQLFERTVAPAASTPSDAPNAPDAPKSSDAPSAPVAGGGVQFSVAPGSVTSAFGWRRDPLTGDAKFHRGIDVRAAYGEDIQAAGNGRVVFSGEQGGYGTTVVVEHGDGVRTRYAHLSVAVVQEGDRVAPGQVLGRAGRSGRATGTHLHFEVTANGRHVNPADWGLTPPGRTGEGV